MRYQKSNIPSSSVVCVEERKTTGGRKGLWDVALIVICCSLALRVLLQARVCEFLQYGVSILYEWRLSSLSMQMHFKHLPDSR